MNETRLDKLIMDSEVDNDGRLPGTRRTQAKTT